MSRAITVCAPSWNIADSYGRVAWETKNALEAEGWTVNTIGPNPPNGTFVPTLLNIMLGHPNFYDQYGAFPNAGLKVALTMWESTELPDGWDEKLNQCAAVIVPCEWNVNVFRNCGVTVPVERIPLGISPAFNYKRRRKQDKFRFLTIGDWDERKGWDKAFFAFIRAFGQDESVELIIKSRRFPKNFGNKNVREILADLTDADMQGLYASCDCMIFPAAGEGFGLPPREFAVSGGISIVTNYGGLADDVEEWALPIGYEEVPAWQHSERWRGLGEWAAADVDELAEKMKQVRVMSIRKRNELGKRFSQNASRLYAWQKFGKDVVALMEKVSDGYSYPA